MTLEPIHSPDDTQPNMPLADEDTQPTQPVVVSEHSSIGLWVLGIVIVLVGLTLIFTFSRLFLASPPPTPIPLSISLVIGDETRRVLTSGQTVADVLREQNVQLNPDDQLSVSLDTPLTDGMTITIGQVRFMELVINGESQIIRTYQESVPEILDAAGIVLTEHDRLWVDGIEVGLNALDSMTDPPTMMVIEKAYHITLFDDGVELIFWTMEETVGEALFTVGVTVYLADQISPDSHTPITEDMEITITRATPIHIQLDGVTVETRVQGKTVGEALVETGAALYGLDYVLPDEDTPITPAMTIHIIRVTEEILTGEEIIPFETSYQSDTSLELDTRATLQAGRNGILQDRIRVRYEDGVEVSREDIGSIVSQQPIAQTIAYGTNIVLRTVDTPEGPREYWRVLHNMITTSYHPAALGGDNITSIGMTLQKGIIGVDPTLIPYRTNMYVPEYGIGIAADTGGPRSTRYWIDLGYSDEDFIGWSRRDVTVYLLTPIPDNINYLLPSR